MGKGIALIDGKVISVLNFARTLSPSLLSVSVQGIWFHTDDYDSRVYASERGLLYTFYTPSFYGKGSVTPLICDMI